MLQNKITGERRAVTPFGLKLAVVALGLATLCGPIYAVEHQHGVLMGTVVEVDSAAKTVVVKTSEGTEHTLRFGAHTTIHGARDVVRGSDDAFHGLGKGSKVVVHYTDEGGKDTADEVDRIGDDGLKAVFESR